MPGMNPRQMKKMMQRMGVKQQEILADYVLIKTAEKELIINNPSVIKVNMMGQETFQISGTVSERVPELKIDEEDIKTVMEQTKADKKTAHSSLKKNKGDLAKTIIELKQI